MKLMTFKYKLMQFSVHFHFSAARLQRFAFCSDDRN